MKITKLLSLLFILTFFFVSTLQAAEITVQPSYYKNLKELKYPQLVNIEDEKTAKKVNNILMTYIENAYEEKTENKKQGKKGNFKTDYQSNYEVKYNKYPELSIVASNYIYSGGAHGNTTVESFNFDFKTGNRIYLTEVLKEEEQLKVVQDYVWEYAIDRPEIFYPDLKIEDVQLTKDTAFYFTDEGITLIFQQYEIAPYVSGNQEIAVPSQVYEQQMLK